MAGQKKIEVYQAKDGWRWRKVGGNGKITADSGEAYSSKSGALDAAKDERAAQVPLLVVLDEEGEEEPA